ncbi:transglutaminase-like domain-containing protein [Denitromonas ohlonensis]|uniref:Transglutaminase family protein n=3 Tax=Denitromonas TaxID=139331 RepID=A0A557REG5_9RHOO|nr:transglutaminase family protein [Denitromonas ohlonensis]TVO63565.1 transglutaminase family protein [Denitromonas ohlonensis]TVO75442.1 transglutaminase family protein [Denitromonas ohlonensis]
MIDASPAVSAPSPADLMATDIIDATHPDVVAMARPLHRREDAPRDTAIRLYHAVRDQIRYDPYKVILTTDAMRASRTLAQGYGWCVTKAALLAALCRACDIPARVGYADVRNHLSTERLNALLGTDVYYWHSYTAIYLDDQWLKATPAFDARLCARAGIAPLEFDGRGDSIFHAFDAAGQRHMEYLHYRGDFSDVPLSSILNTFAARHPKLMALSDGDFFTELEASPP